MSRADRMRLMPRTAPDSNADAAVTIAVGTVDDTSRRLIDVTRASLEAAIADFEKALQLDPDDSAARRQLELARRQRAERARPDGTGT